MLRATFADRLIVLPGRLLDPMQDAFALVVRLWVGLDFFRSGWLKITSWENTLFLFREEYHVPLLPPNLAAIAGTTGELVFPILIWLGLFGRLSALGMSAVNVMAVLAYAHVLLAEGFEAALAQHILWGFALVVLALYGPGRISVDWILLRGSGQHRTISNASLG